MDLFTINWNERAKNDPVVNHFFKDYVYGGEYIKSNTTDIKIKNKETDKITQPQVTNTEPALPKPKKKK
jgi:hypothetical protein